VLSLFGDDELDHILIEDFADTCTEKVKSSSLKVLMDAKIISISADNQTKLNSKLGTTWQNLTIDQLLNAIIMLV
jgi:hypothetical protein